MASCNQDYKTEVDQIHLKFVNGITSVLAGSKVASHSDWTTIVASAFGSFSRDAAEEDIVRHVEEWPVRQWRPRP